VHPIYKIEVCGETSLATCAAAGATWTPLDQWVAQPTNPD
jgi:hypothetical protein